LPFEKTFVRKTGAHHFSFNISHPRLRFLLHISDQNLLHWQASGTSQSMPKFCNAGYFIRFYLAHRC